MHIIPQIISTLSNIESVSDRLDKSFVAKFWLNSSHTLEQIEKQVLYAIICSNEGKIITIVTIIPKIPTVDFIVFTQ